MTHYNTEKKLGSQEVRSEGWVLRKIDRCKEPAKHQRSRVRRNMDVNSSRPDVL